MKITALILSLVLSLTSANAALVSRIYNFTDGQILTATQLNSEFNNLVDGVNGINDANVVSGANISPLKISSVIKGAALNRNGSTGELSVKVDNVGIEVSGDQLQLKAGGITAASIADGTITLAKLVAAVQQSLVPIGAFLPYSGVAAPAGYLLCDGTQVSRVTYAALFAAIGSTYGDGDGSSTFHLPDFRGRVLRGVDNGAGNDPDAVSRTAMNLGGNVGDNVGSIQSHEVQSHAHGVNDPGHTHTEFKADGATAAQAGVGSPGFSQTVPGFPTGASGTGISIQNTGGSETRMKNANVNYIIKY